MSEDIHYRKAFDSPYLSSADIVDMTTLTISHVTLASDKTKKTKDEFNTAHFVEKEIRKGEPLKPMILNATNSKIMKALTGTPFINKWVNVRVNIYVDHAVRFGRETVEGLRISPVPPEASRAVITPESKAWERAKSAYKRDGNLNSVLEKVDISDDHQAQLIKECNAEADAKAENVG